MVTHRYVGVALGLVMLMWFASGVVMLFVHWPEVTPEQRARGLAPIDWSRCCAFGDTVDPQEVRHGVVESLAGRPVLRFDGEVLDLTSGRMVDQVSAADARAVAVAHGAATGVRGTAKAVAGVSRDQWTVTGYFDKRRPFWRFAFDDPRRTDIYVSAKTGEIAQVTDRSTRILNWLGPIPHWLYPSVLRANTEAWSQVVVWLSILGTFLTLTGLYLGVIAWRPWGDGRLTPYRGLMAWHHLTGLVAGVLTLTWVFSGLVSMNPWGFLESEPNRAAERIAGSVTFGEVKLAVLAAQRERPSVHRLETAPLGGRLYMMADGARLDRAGRAAPLGEGEIAKAAGALGPILSQKTITEGDAYYFSHHASVRLPARRIELVNGDRVYLDPASGRVLQQVDAAARSYRWLHEGLHRLDFLPGLHSGPAWAAIMVVLLILAGGGVGTGVWLGWRRAGADVKALRSKGPERR